MMWLALVLSVLALGALGLVACGGGDDETTAASATETTDDGTTGGALAADSKSCGAYMRWRLAVVDGGISCRMARRVVHGLAYQRVPDGWICTGGDQTVRCVSEAEERIRAPVRKAVLRRWEAAAPSESEPTADEIAELAADNKSCGAFGRDHDPPWKLAVVEGDISCRVTRLVMHDWADERLPGSWNCIGPESKVVCTKKPDSSRIVITARFG